MAAGCSGGKHKVGARTTQVQILALLLRTVDCGSPFTTLSSRRPLRNGTMTPTKRDDDSYLRTKGDSCAYKAPPGCPVKANILLLNQRWEPALPKVPSPGLLSDCTPSSHLARLASPPWLYLRRGLRQAPEEPRAGLCRSRLPPSGCLACQEAALALIKQVPLLLGACFNQGRTAGGVISCACAWAHGVAVAGGVPL